MNDPGIQQTQNGDALNSLPAQQQTRGQLQQYSTLPKYQSLTDSDGEQEARTTSTRLNTKKGRDIKDTNIPCQVKIILRLLLMTAADY